MPSMLVRNERVKLMANYLNSIASATFVGGWLPLFAAWSLGAGQMTQGSVFVMVVALTMSVTMFSIARRVLGQLEENP